MSERRADDGYAGAHLRLVEPDDLLYRQVKRPEYLDDDRPTYRAFLPHSESDQLSVHQGSVVSALESYELYVEGDDGCPLRSEGAWAVSVYEVEQSQLHGAFDDSSQDPQKPRGHAYISFANNPEPGGRPHERWRKRRGGNLAQHASVRGPKYVPPVPSVTTTQTSLGI